MLQAMSSQLLHDSALKLQRCNVVALAQLMHAQNKFLQDKSQWPLFQAVIQQVMEHLERLPPNKQQQEQQQDEQQQQQKPQLDAQRTANAIAQLAFLLERAQLQSPEYLTAIHRQVVLHSVFIPICEDYCYNSKACTAAYTYPWVDGLAASCSCLVLCDIP
jgi:hypothetical protein